MHFLFIYFCCCCCFFLKFTFSINVGFILLTHTPVYVDCNCLHCNNVSLSIIVLCTPRAKDVCYMILTISNNWLYQCDINTLHTLRVHYAHAAANLNSGYSKYAKVARVHYFCTIALRTSRAVLTRALASRRVDLRERRVDSFSKRVIIFCW